MQRKNYWEDTYQNTAMVISNDGITSDFSHCYFLNNFMCFSKFFSEHDLCL